MRISPEASWVALLPIAMFYHENEFRLAQKLKQAISLCPEMESRTSDLMALGWAIGHLIKPKIEITTTIPHIINHLENFKPNDSPLLSQNLPKISSLLAEYASLETVMLQLKTNNARESAILAPRTLLFFVYPRKLSGFCSTCHSDSTTAASDRAAHRCIIRGL